MINNISWQGYWTSIALLTGSYYLTIFLLYYRSDFKNWIAAKRSGHLQTVTSTPVPYSPKEEAVSNNELQQTSLFGEDLAPDFETPQEESLEYAFYACMDEVSAFFEEAKRSRCVKDNIVQSLKLIISKYPFLKDSEYKESLTNVIIAQCEQNCSIHLNAEEVVHVWFDQ